MQQHEKKAELYQHIACEYFPCHATDEPDDFNCLFCYCPLYALGESCGGQYSYTEKGIKNCKGCLFPHEKRNYPNVLKRLSEIVELAKRKHL